MGTVRVCVCGRGFVVLVGPERQLPEFELGEK
jgi:hypothetical protein